MNCGNSSADVSWQASLGARRYDVSAAAAGCGAPVSCSTGGATTCRLQGLTCGRLYSVSLVAVGDACSTRSGVVSLRTGEQRGGSGTLKR